MHSSQRTIKHIQWVKCRLSRRASPQLPKSRTNATWWQLRTQSQVKRNIQRLRRITVRNMVEIVRGENLPGDGVFQGGSDRKISGYEVCSNHVMLLEHWANKFGFATKNCKYNFCNEASTMFSQWCSSWFQQTPFQSKNLFLMSISLSNFEILPAIFLHHKIIELDLTFKICFFVVVFWRRKKNAQKQLTH